MISKSTKEPEKLAKWLSFMTSPEGMILSSFGIEGVHYTKDERSHYKNGKRISRSNRQQQNGSGYILAICQHGIP